jgi:hypothetical protein
MAAVIIAGGLSNKNRWQELQAEAAREKVKVKTLAGRVKPLEEPSEAKIFNRYMPEAVRIKRKPWLYFARVGSKTHLLDHDPARAYVAGVDYLLYYVGNTSAPLVLSAEPKKGRP